MDAEKGKKAGLSHAPITREDLDRIEEKLDRLIEFFRIGQVPTRPAPELSSLADATILRLKSRNRKNTKKS